MTGTTLTAALSSYLEYGPLTIQNQMDTTFESDMTNYLTSAFHAILSMLYVSLWPLLTFAIVLFCLSLTILFLLIPFAYLTTLLYERCANWFKLYRGRS